MNKIDTYEIHHIHHLIEVGTKLNPLWFRGHSKCFGNLQPQIFREKPSQLKDWFFGTIEEREFSYIEEYQRKVPMFADHIPAKHDIRWLLMMQHYGAPTRLLDWTENVLVAAYFAVHENLDQDGEIWIIFPQKINKHYAGEAFWLWDSPNISYLAQEPFAENPNKIAEQLGLTVIPKTPLAFYPPLSNPRMVAQSSVFTIHPKPKNDESNTITALLKNTKDGIEIVRYIIPAKYKKGIYSDLNKLGINRTRLFPEQESVAIDMVNHPYPRVASFLVAPECGGKL